MARRPTHRKKYISRTSLLVAVLLLVLLGGAYALYRHHQSAKTPSTNPKVTSNPVNNKPAPAADNKPNEDRKTSSAPSDTLNSNPATPASFNVQIVSTRVSGGNLHVGSQVNGITSGSCTLTATKSNQTVQLLTSSVVQDVNSYDCGPLNASTSKFPSTGDWKLQLSVTANGTTASDNTTVTIN